MVNIQTSPVNSTEFHIDDLVTYFIAIGLTCWVSGGYRRRGGRHERSG